MTLEYKVLEKKDTNYILEGVFRHIVHNEENEGFKARLNTGIMAENVNTNNTTAFVPGITLLNEPFRFSISQNRNNLDIADINRILDNKIKRWEIDSETIQLFRDNTLDFARTVLLSTLFRVPDHIKPVAAAAWTDEATKRNYTVNIQGNQMHITSKRAENTNGYNEKIVIDLKNGMLISKTSDIKEKVFFNDQKFDFTSILNVKESNNKKLEVVGIEGWDMIMKGAFFSDALKTNMEFDSVKVIKYASKYSQFNDCPIYITNKLNLLQRINNHKLYDNELKKTSSHLVAGTHHLHNKIRDWNNNSIDSVVHMAKLIDDKGVYSWLQHSYAQRFLGNRKYLSEDGLEVLKQLATDDRMKYYTTPVYNWASAINQEETNKNFNAVAEDLLLLNNEYWNKGNVGRYTILIAQELMNIEKFDESKNVLDKTIQKLESLVNDKTNEKRLIHKMLLAHAWYQQYLLAAKSNTSTDKLLYLEKAAFYSPKNEAEKTHDSWYDNVFVKGEENYTNIYLEELSLRGEQDKVLSKFVSAFATMPSSLYEIKNFYQKYYPEKDFSEFFINTLIPTLKDAPYFQLTDIHGKNVSLNDIKGKWYVIDFWGTWCGPCVAEMPELNKYYNAIKADKNSKINFLSIACNDTKEKVVNFLEKRNYNIPVLMSNQKVEKDYSIMRYPTKMIITPTGKIIMMDSGYDWQKYINDLVSL